VLTLPAKKEARFVNGLLAVLVLYEGVIRLQALEPDAGAQQVLPAGECHLVGGRKDVAICAQIASRVGAPLVICEAPFSVVPPPTTSAPTGWFACTQPAPFSSELIVTPLSK